MSIFLDCIVTAVESGRLTEKKRAEAEEAFVEAEDSMLRNGVSEDKAEYAAAHEALKRTTELKQGQRRARIAELRKHHELMESVKATEVDDLPALMSQTIQNAVDDYKAVHSQLVRIMRKLVLKYSPKAAGFHLPKAGQEDIVFGVYGRNVSKENKELAQSVKDYLAFEDKLLRAEGVTRPKNENFRLWNSHDEAAIRNAGKQVWVNKHLGQVNGEDVLDWDIMRYKGKPIPVDQRKEILEEVADGILSRGKHRQKPGQADNLSLAARIERDRFLYYKTPEAWIAMNREFGTGDFFHQLVDHIDSTARSVSLLRTFGPNPTTGQKFFQRAVEQKTENVIKNIETQKAAKKVRGKLQARLTAFQEAYDIHARNIDTGEASTMAQVMASARSLSTSAVLGEAIVANLGDPFYATWARQINKMPVMSVVPQYFKAILNYPNFRAQLIDDGIAVESLTRMAYESTRYNLTMEGSYITNRIADQVYRMQLLTNFTQIGRGIAAQDFSRGLAAMREVDFDDIPFAHLLKAVGVTAEDWKLVRETPLHEPQYYNFGKGKRLRPIDMLERATTDAQRRAAEKFLRFQEFMGREGIPNPTIMSRQFLGDAMPRSQVYTQFMKSMTQLMLFPTSVHFQYWKRAWQAPTITQRVARMGALFAYSTAAGAMIAQIKDVLSGKKLHSMDTKEFWIRAMLLGGAGGIVGDFLFQGTLLGSPYAPNTPLGKNIANLRRLTLDNFKAAMDGDELHLGADIARVGWGLFPYKPPGIKLVLERSLMDSVLEHSDPEGFRRQIAAERAWERDQGQGVWWGVGGRPEFSELFGG